MANLPFRAVFDTNVVLDWLVFEDSATLSIAARIHAARLVIVTHTAAIEELRHVLAYPKLGLDEPSQRRALERYQACAVRHEHDERPLPRGFPRCRDPDDDHFLALAYRSGADALVSRDKAVLKLRRRAAAFGVIILDLQQLQQSFAQSALASASARATR